MPVDYSAMASGLIAHFGITGYVNAKRLEGGTLDPVTGEITGGTIQSTELNAVVINVADDLIDGERIQIGDKQIIFDNAYTPIMEDTYEFGSKEYKTVLIDGLNHAGTPQYWRVVCRG